MLRVYIALMMMISLFVACNSPKMETASRISPETEKKIIEDIAQDTTRMDASKVKIAVDTTTKKGK